jgi:hypothetical protein
VDTPTVSAVGAGDGGVRFSVNEHPLGTEQGATPGRHTALSIEFGHDQASPFAARSRARFTATRAKCASASHAQGELQRGLAQEKMQLASAFCKDHVLGMVLSTANPFVFNEVVLATDLLCSQLDWTCILAAIQVLNIHRSEEEEADCE